MLKSNFCYCINQDELDVKASPYVMTYNIQLKTNVSPVLVSNLRPFFINAIKLLFEELFAL